MRPEAEGSDPAAGERLLAERDRLSADLEWMDAAMDRLVAASREDNADDEHDPEGQTIAWERAQLAASTTATRRRREEVEAALGRVADGSYGICTVCGGPITPGRLEARPTALTCVQHVPRGG